MRTLIYGAGPIGQWLALRLKKSGADVTVLARGETFRQLDRHGIEIVDGLTGERHVAHVDLVESLEPEDRYELVVVAMQKASRLAVCPILARNSHLENILFLGNDVSGFHRYLHYLSEERILFGFPGAGGGLRGDDLVILDREKPEGSFGKLYIGELDGESRSRTLNIKELFEATGMDVNIEKDIGGWLKYHFAFIAPTTGAIFEKGGDLSAVAGDVEIIHRYCAACREAGDVLKGLGFRKRQPPIFNLFYWLPRWLEPVVFRRLFSSQAAEIRFGLHAPHVAVELLEMADEFSALKAEAGLETPRLDAFLRGVSKPPPVGENDSYSLGGKACHGVS